mmetsp:Transcript_56689/g.159073  ORF Transcript_56689/g.159073 Transcript_56689/m.159073 type:complete len:216 (-) Transcript_56689:54-701(-)
MGRDGGHNAVRPGVHDVQPLVLACPGQHGAAVVPPQGQHLVGDGGGEGHLLSRHVPDLASHVEGGGRDDVRGGGVERAEADLLLVALECGDRVLEVVLETLVGQGPHLDRVVLACTNEHVVVEGVEFEVQHGRGVPCDSRHISWHFSQLSDRKDSQGTAASCPRDDQELAIAPQPDRLGCLGGVLDVVVLCLPCLAEDMPELGVPDERHPCKGGA